MRWIFNLTDYLWSCVCTFGPHLDLSIFVLSSLCRTASIDMLMLVSNEEIMACRHGHDIEGNGCSDGSQ